MKFIQEMKERVFPQETVSVEKTLVPTAEVIGRSSETGRGKEWNVHDSISSLHS